MVAVFAISNFDASNVIYPLKVNTCWNVSYGNVTKQDY